MPNGNVSSFPSTSVNRSELGLQPKVDGVEVSQVQWRISKDCEAMGALNFTATESLFDDGFHKGNHPLLVRKIQ